MKLLRLAAPLLPIVIAVAACNDTTPLATIDCTALALTLSAAAPTLTTLPDGLQYRDVTVGSGATFSAGKTVGVHYGACLVTGSQFDSNLDYEPAFTFKLGLVPPTVIKGFDEGLVGMKVGGRRQLVIPPALAYGATGAGNVVPPNATLVFTVDAVSAQ